MLTAAAPRTHTKIPEHAFQGVLWALIATDVLFVLIRLAIRVKMFKRLFWDDLCVILALAMFLTSAILWRYNLFRVFLLYEAVSGRRPFDQAAVDNWDTFLHLVVPLNVLYYSSLWAVKFSFLVFFHKLGNKVRKFETWWWCVFAVTAASYIACIADMQYECTRPYKSASYIIAVCNTIEKIDWVTKTTYANCVLDVGTDILILSIPISILWNTGVPLRKKLVLGSMFSATVAIMIMAIVRVPAVIEPGKSADAVWLYFWSNLEVGIAILISCVVSFRQLFIAKHGQSENTSSTADHSSNWRIPFSNSMKSTDKEWTSTSQIAESHTSSNGPFSQGRGCSEDSDAPLHFQTTHSLNQKATVENV